MKFSFAISLATLTLPKAHSQRTASLPPRGLRAERLQGIVAAKCPQINCPDVELDSLVHCDFSKRPDALFDIIEDEKSEFLACLCCGDSKPFELQEKSSGDTGSRIDMKGGRPQGAPGSGRPNMGMGGTVGGGTMGPGGRPGMGRPGQGGPIGGKHGQGSSQGGSIGGKPGQGSGGSGGSSGDTGSSMDMKGGRPQGAPGSGRPSLGMGGTVGDGTMGSGGRPGMGRPGQGGPTGGKPGQGSGQGGSIGGKPGQGSGGSGGSDAGAADCSGVKLVKTVSGKSATCDGYHGEDAPFHLWPVGVSSDYCHGWSGSGHYNSANIIRCSADGTKLLYTQYAGSTDCTSVINPNGVEKEYVLDECHQGIPSVLYDMATDFDCCLDPNGESCMNELTGTPGVFKTDADIWMNGEQCDKSGDEAFNDVDRGEFTRATVFDYNNDTPAFDNNSEMQEVDNPASHRGVSVFSLLCAILYFAL